MSNEVVSAIYVADSAKAYKSGFFETHIKYSKLGTMFFKPYASTDEFFYCLPHILCPLLIVGTGACSPLLFTCVIGGVLGGTIAEGIKMDGFTLNTLIKISTTLLQIAIDLIVLPIAILSMMTRGVSTGLQMAEFYDYDLSLGSNVKK